MSRSIHATVKGLTRDRLSKATLNEMAQRDDTELTDLAKKRAIKRSVREARRERRANLSDPEDVSPADKTEAHE